MSDLELTIAIAVPLAFILLIMCFVAKDFLEYKKENE